MGKYKNANDILPKNLVKEIQKYIQGAHLYIPQNNRKVWGTDTGIREELQERNLQIIIAFQNGVEIAELSKRYCLSEERIRSILYSKSKE